MTVSADIGQKDLSRKDLGHEPAPEIAAPRRVFPGLIVLLAFPRGIFALSRA